MVDDRSGVVEAGDEDEVPRVPPPPGKVRAGVDEQRVPGFQNDLADLLRELLPAAVDGDDRRLDSGTGSRRALTLIPTRGELCEMTTSANWCPVRGPAWGSRRTPLFLGSKCWTGRGGGSTSWCSTGSSPRIF